MKKFLLLIFAFTLFSCADDKLPKPKGQLKLEYPVPEYDLNISGCNYSFLANNLTKIKSKDDCSLELNYPKMKATLYLSYKPVNDNIDKLLRDAQKLTYDHVVKADDILEQPFENLDQKVYGMFYEVGGNAATNVQFYLTDSTRNFVRGSLYFYIKPNFDSILPATNYIKTDVRKLMESFKWK